MLNVHVPAEVQQGNDALPSSFSSHTINKCLYHSICSAIVFAFLYFLSVISLFIAPKHSAEVLSSAPKKSTSQESCDVSYGDELHSGLS